MSDLNSISLQQTSSSSEGTDLVKAIIKNYSDQELAEGFVWSSNEYFMEVKLPGESNLEKKLPLETRAKVYVKNPFGIEECYYVTVADVQEYTARLKIRHKEYPANAREYYRITTNISTAIEYQLIEEEKVQLPQPIPITVKNLSCGGMMFATSGDFKEGDQYQVTLELDQIPLIVRFKILRKESKDQTYFYGVLFLNNTPQKEDIIYGYINRLQKQEIKKLNKL